MGVVSINSESYIQKRIIHDNIINELVIFLRNNLPDRKNRTLTFTETHLLSSRREIELSKDKDNNGIHKVMNIKSLTVNGNELVYLRDYVVGYKFQNYDDQYVRNGFVKFYNKINGKVIIEYCAFYSFIYPEHPRTDLTSNAYPRITIEHFNDSDDFGIGGHCSENTITIYISVVDITIQSVRSIINELKNMFITEQIKKGFQTFNYIRIKKIHPGPSKVSEDINNLLYGQQIELVIPFQFEFGM